MTHTLRIMVLGLCLIGWTGAAFFPTMGSALAAEETAGKDTVRPEVGQPLQAAQELSKAKQYKEALAKIDEAEAVKDKTAFETYLIARTRGVTAFSDGQTELAAQSFATAIGFDRLAASEFLEITRALAVQFYNKPDYPNATIWATRYIDKGGPDPQLKVLLAQSYYLSNDFAKAATLLQDINHADEAAGRVTAENQLQLWANCELQLKRHAGMVTTLEKLVTHYPKKDYWNDLIRQVQRNPTFSERLTLDAYRLQRYAGALDGADEVLEMAGLAMQAGFPAEAKQLLDRGYADKLLGAGANEARHKKLQEQANKGVAEDLKSMAQDEKRAESAKTGTVPVNTGFNLVLHGQHAKGIALIDAGIAKGGLKFPEDARLKLGMAYLYAGQKDKAVQAFKSITGNDGTTDLARLWIIRINQG
ncbi:MAG: tetratricopeptide repeat protein [Proteobacteria bacterium]|nr:tetratricopeptide repeat protein [Pseudomonadota bacterium]